MPSLAIVPNVFSAEECKVIIEQGKSLSVQKANLDEADNTLLDESYRNGKITLFSPDNEQHAWIYEKSTQVFRSINEQFWKFELDGEPDYLQFTIYEQGDFYDWHLDIGEIESGTGNRKLSSVVQLVDPESYEGGELEFFVDRFQRPVPKDLGSMIIFPSYNLHRVKPVTKGVRYSLVHWMSGKTPYR